MSSSKKGENMKPFVKHMVTAVVWIVLGLLGARYGLDFTNSCPKNPPPLSEAK